MKFMASKKETDQDEYESEEEKENNGQEGQDEMEEEFQKARRSSRLASKNRPNYAENIEDDVDAILELVAEVRAARAIEHLLPKKAKHLPFFEAINFIRFDTLSVTDFRLLLQLGWSVPNTTATAAPTAAPSPIQAPSNARTDRVTRSQRATGTQLEPTKPAQTPKQSSTKTKAARALSRLADYPESSPEPHASAKSAVAPLEPRASKSAVAPRASRAAAPAAQLLSQTLKHTQQLASRTTSAPTSHKRTLEVPARAQQAPKRTLEVPARAQQAAAAPTRTSTAPANSSGRGIRALAAAHASLAKKK